MDPELTAAIDAVALDAPYDRVWAPLVPDLAVALDVGLASPFHVAVEDQARIAADDPQLRLADVYRALSEGFGSLREVLAGEPAASPATVSALDLLEHQAFAHAGLGYAEGLEAAVGSLSAQVSTLSTVDPSTGVMKDEAIVDLFAAEAGRCRRMEMSLGVFAVQFIGLDEASGTREAGEPAEFLRRAAGLLADSLRQYDAVGRRGAYGFLAVLPDVSRRGLQSVIERVRRELDEVRPAHSRVKYHVALTHLDYVDLGARDLLGALDETLAREAGHVDALVWT